MAEPLNPLDLDGKALHDELARIESEGAQVEAEVDTEGATAEVAYSWRNGWGVAAYVKSKWKGETVAGGRVSKKW